MIEKSSNLLYVLPTKFTDTTSGHETYGFRLFDDVVSVYDNTWDSIPDSDEELLRRVFETEDSSVREILEVWAGDPEQNPIIIRNKPWTIAQVETSLGRELDKDPFELDEGELEELEPLCPRCQAELDADG